MLILTSKTTKQPEGGEMIKAVEKKGRANKDFNPKKEYRRRIQVREAVERGKNIILGQVERNS